MKNSAPSENRESHKNDENDKRENNKSKNEWKFEYFKMNFIIIKNLNKY